MDLEEQFILIEIFEQNAADKRRKARVLEEESDRVFEEHKQEKHREEEEKKFFGELLAATDRQISFFRNQLDDYDTGSCMPSWIMSALWMTPANTAKSLKPRLTSCRTAGWLSRRKTASASSIRTGWNCLTTR